MSDSDDSSADLPTGSVLAHVEGVHSWQASEAAASPLDDGSGDSIGPLPSAAPAVSFALLAPSSQASPYVAFRGDEDGGGGEQNFAFIEATRGPLPFPPRQLVASQLADIAEAQQRIAATIADEVQQRLWCHTEFRFTLPRSQLTADFQPLNRMHAAAGEDELRALALHPTTQRHLPLTRAEANSIARTRRLHIASARYPGKTHVWEVSPMLLSGSEGIVRTWKRRVGCACNQLLLETGNRLFGSPHAVTSIPRAAHRLSSTAARAFDLLFGTPRSHQLPADQVAALLDIERQAYALRGYDVTAFWGPRPAANAPAAALDSRQASYNDADNWLLLPRRLLRADTNNNDDDGAPAQLDLRIVSSHLMATQQLIERLQQQLWDDWRLQRERIVREAVADVTGQRLQDDLPRDALQLTPAMAEQVIAQVIARHEHSLYRLLRGCAELDDIGGAGYAELLVAYLRMMSADKAVRAELAAERAAEEAAAVQEIKDTCRGCSPGLVARNVRQRLAAFDEQFRVRHLRKLIEALERSGLKFQAQHTSNDDASRPHKDNDDDDDSDDEEKKANDGGFLTQLYYLAQANLRFLEEHAEQTAAELSAPRPAQPRQLFRHYWDKDMYRTEGQVLIKEERFEVPVDVHCWRCRYDCVRSYTCTSNWLYFWIFKCLLNGRVGMRFLCSSQPWYRSVTLDGSGRIVPSRQVHPFKTYVERLHASVLRSVEAFERQPDTGILSRGLTRIPNRCWNYCVVWACGMTWLSLCAPLLSVGSALLSLLMIVVGCLMPCLSFVGASLGRLCCWDPHGPKRGAQHRCLPCPADLLRVLCSCGEIFLSLCMAAAGHPLIAGLVSCGASVLAALQNCRTCCVRYCLIGPFGRRPQANSVWVRRVAGPGLGMGYYEHISTEQTLLFLHVMLEHVLQTVVQQRIAAAIQAPYERYQAFLQPLLAHLGAAAGLSADVVLPNHADQLGLLQRAINSSRITANFYALRSLQLGRARQTPDELAHTLVAAEALVRAFCTDNVLPLVAPSWWAGYDVAPDDWPSLTQALLRQVIGPQFLVPLEPSDTTIELDLHYPELLQEFSARLAGEHDDDPFERVLVRVLSDANRIESETKQEFQSRMHMQVQPELLPVNVFSWERLARLFRWRADHPNQPYLEV